MSEKLIIRNFGPITNVDLDLRKVNVLIGEQGTGKSAIVKLISSIVKMSTGETLTAGKTGLMRKEEFGKVEHLRRHLKVFGIEGYLTETTYIFFDSPLFEFEFVEKDCRIIKTKLIKGLEAELSHQGITFIPADRGAVNLLSNELLYSLNELSQDLPGYFVRFGQQFNRSKKHQKVYDFSETLGVSYKFENDQDQIVIANNKVIMLSDASSAVQTNIPMLVILKNQELGKDNFGGHSSDFLTTILEEPELNCHPKLQNLLVKSIVLNAKPSIKENFRRVIFMTTHSPYILTSLNNLIYAHEVGKIYPDEAEKVIERKYWLNPKDVSAYELKTDGTCEDIFNREENLIGAEKIDEISNVLNEQFDALLNIELVPR